MLNLLESQQFNHVPLPDKMDGSTFKESVLFFLENGELLIGVIRDGEWHMNPQHDMELDKDDTLLLLSAW